MDNAARGCERGGAAQGTGGGGVSDEAAWAASVRWSGETPDPWAFFCPNSDDAVPKGMELGGDEPIAERNTPGIVGYGALRPLCLLADTE